MKRREFIAGLGGAAVLRPLAGRAQVTSKLPTIGFLGSVSPSVWNPYVAAFEQRLHELGWIKDRTIAIEYRWAEGHSERFTEIADEFARLKVDVIVASGGSAIAAKRATSTIPIVLAIASDPVGDGLVVSFARPGGNVTGLSLQASDLVGKRLELLREVLPNFRRLAIIANVSYRATVQEMQQVRKLAGALGIEAVPLEIRQAKDIAPVFETYKDGAEALYVCSDPLLASNRTRLNTLALAARLPTMEGLREFVEAGGLISYGPHVPDLFRRAAGYVDKILRGAKPGDLPVEQPTKFDLIVNLTTAKALGIAIPEGFLLRADEVIE